MLRRPEILIKPSPVFTYVILISAESNFLAIFWYSLGKIDKNGNLPKLIFKHIDKGQVFKDHLLQTQERYNPMSTKSGKRLVEG